MEECNENIEAKLTEIALFEHKNNSSTVIEVIRTFLLLFFFYEEILSI